MSEDLDLGHEDCEVCNRARQEPMQTALQGLADVLAAILEDEMITIGLFDKAEAALEAARPFLDSKVQQQPPSNVSST